MNTSKRWLQGVSLLIAGLSLFFTQCQTQLEVEAIPRPDSLSGSTPTTADLNFLVRNVSGDTIRMQDSVQVELYVKAQPTPVGSNSMASTSGTFQLSFAVSGGDGDFYVGGQVLRANDWSRVMPLTDLSNHTKTGFYRPYRLSPTGATTLTFTLKDGAKQQTATLPVYVKR